MELQTNLRSWSNGVEEDFLAGSGTKGVISLSLLGVKWEEELIFFFGAVECFLVLVKLTLSAIMKAKRPSFSTFRIEATGGGNKKASLVVSNMSKSSSFSQSTSVSLI